MVVLKKRPMMVTFRLTSEEHEAMTRCCVEGGARSLAEFARAAVLQKMQAQRTPSGTITGDLMTLSKGLRQLDSSLGNLRKQIRGLLGPVTSRINGKTESPSGNTRED
jgi:hypothetical protein